jgi:alanyl-tRNA synthetase
VKEYYFRIDPYAKELETEITDISGDQVFLKDTILYPGGGGQPPDIGKIIGADFEADITATKNQEVIVHNLSNVRGTLKKERVKVVLDWDRRYALMKAHSGEHIFFRALELLYPIKFEKVEFSPKESVLFISGDVTFEQIKEAEVLANQTIKEARNIVVSSVSQDTITSDVRLKRDRIKDESVRVVEIEDFDKSACTGIHVKNTKEIEMVIATKLKKSKYFEIFFMVSSYARDYIKNAVIDLYQIEKLFNLSGSELIKKLSTMKIDFEALKEAYYDVTAKMYKFEVINFKALNFYWAMSELGDFKGIEKRAQDIISSEDSIVLYGNENEEKILLLFSKSISLDLQPIYKILEKYNQKGGGKGNFLLIQANKDLFKELFEEMKKFIIENLNK